MKKATIVVTEKLYNELKVGADSYELSVGDFVSEKILAPQVDNKCILRKT